MRMVRSCPAVTTVRPSGRNAAAWMPPGSASVVAGRPSAQASRDPMKAGPSPPTFRTVAPSRENARIREGPGWLAVGPTGRAVAVSQSRTEPSPQPIAASVPSGLRAIAETSAS